MILIRSVFWLTIAFFALGPTFDVRQAVDELSSSALHSGTELVNNQVNAVQCASLECVGAKLVVTNGLGTIEAHFEDEPEPMHIAAPRPRPRLVRI